MVSSRQDSFHPPSRGEVLPAAEPLGARRRLHLRWPAQARWRVLILAVVAAVLLGAGAISIALIRSSPTPVPGGPAPTPPAIRAAAAAHAAAARWIAAQVSTDAIVSCDPQMCAVLEAHGIRAGRLLPLGGSNSAPLGSDLIVSTESVRSEFGARLNNVYAPVVLASFGTGSVQTAIRVVAPDGSAAYMRSLRADMAKRAFLGRRCCRTPGSMLPARPAARWPPARSIPACSPRSPSWSTSTRWIWSIFPGPPAERARACRCEPWTSPWPGRGSGTGPRRWPRWPVSCGTSRPRSSLPASPSSGWPRPAGTARRVRRAQPSRTARQGLTEPEQTSATHHQRWAWVCTGSVPSIDDRPASPSSADGAYQDAHRDANSRLYTWWEDQGQMFSPAGRASPPQLPAGGPSPA